MFYLPPVLPLAYADNIRDPESAPPTEGVRGKARGNHLPRFCFESKQNMAS